MEATNPLRRRHIYVIDKEFQYRFLSTFLMMTFGFVLIIGAVMLLGVNLLKQTGAGSVMQHGVEEMKLGVLVDMLKANALFIALLTVFLALYLLLLSHRVAGPAYRITRSIERMLAGDYDFAVVLRSKDYMKDVAQSMNLLLKDLQERQQSVRSALEEATRVSKGLKDGGGSAELQASAERLCATLNGLLKKRDMGFDSQVQSLPADGAGSAAPSTGH